MSSQASQPFTIILYCENKVGLLSRMTSILTRRKINIESLTTSATLWDDIHCMTLLIHISPSKIDSLVQQIEKQIDVLKAEYHQDEEIVFQEVGLFKLAISSMTQDGAVEQIVREQNARIISVEPDFIVVEKSGHEKEVSGLLEKLRPYGLLHFARSGRVAIPKPDILSFAVEKAGVPAHGQALKSS